MHVAVSDPRIPLINSLLQKYGLSNRWLARKLGANHTSVNSWLSEDGARPREPATYDQMLEIVRAEGPKDRVITARRGGIRLVPVYAAIPAGPPASHSMDVEYEEMLDWGTDFERWGRLIDGYSMAPILRPGDRAIFENRRYESGDVVHAFKGGEDCIKCIRGIGDNVQLWSFNEDYPPFSAQDWKAKGVCVTRIRYSAYGIRQQTDFPHGLKWAMRHEDI